VVVPPAWRRSRPHGDVGARTVRLVHPCGAQAYRGAPRSRKIVEDPASAEDLVPDRCFEQVLHGGRFHVGAFGSVIVAVLAGIENAGKSVEGGVGDLGEDGGLPAGLVPQDLQVERVEQAGFEVGGQAGQDVPGQRQLLQQRGVGGFGGGDGQGGEPGLGLLTVGVQFGEPGGDAGAHRGRGGVVRVGGELFQGQDLGVLRGLELLEPGLEGRCLGVAVRGGGGELGGEQGGAAGTEDVGGEEQATSGSRSSAATSART
jgi:hypothetical protein